MLSESDLLSALATEKEKSPAKQVATAPEVSEAPVSPEGADGQIGNESELAPDNLKQTSFTADFDAGIEESIEPASNASPGIPGELVPAEQPASKDGLDAKSAPALSEELFTADELESALAEVDAVALKSEAVLEPVNSTAFENDRALESAESANPALPTDLVHPAANSISPDPLVSTENEHAAEGAHDEVAPIEPPESSNDDKADQSQKEQPPATPAKGLKFAIGKKTPAAASNSTDTTAGPPADISPAPVGGQGILPEPATTPPNPRTQVLKLLIRAVEGGLDAIHKPIYARMPGVLRLIGIWSVCTIIVSLIFIFGLPVLMSRNDAISHLEQCLLALSGNASDANSDDDEKESADSHGAEKGKKNSTADKKSEKHGDAKKDGHPAESSHAEKKPAQGPKHGDEGAKKKEAAGHGAPKADAGHGAAPKAKPKEKPKSKKAQKPKDAHGTGH